MPLYEYECPNGHRWEALKKSLEVDGIPCPTCGLSGKRLISPCNYSFGWKLSDESHNVRFHKDELVRDV
jgi:putative FmdB family regulatory protein